MGNKNILLALVLLFNGAFMAFGQENIKSTVTVTREYENKLEGVVKSDFGTSYSDTLQKFKLHFDYSAFDRPYKDLYEFSPVEGIQLPAKGVVRYPVLYFKGALGYPLMPEADLYVQPNVGIKNSLVFYANHHSFWGNKGYDSPVNESVTTGGLGYAYHWKTGEARLNGYYRHNFHKYKETDFYSYNPQMTQNVGGNLSVKSLDSKPGAFHYDFNLSGVATSIRDYAREIFFDGSLDLGFRLSGKHRMFVNVGFENSTYDNKYVDGTVLKGNGGLISVEPQYAYSFGRLSLAVGIGLAGIYGDPLGVEGNGDCAHVYPKVKVAYEAVKGSLWLKAMVDGGNTFMSITELLRMNPWLTPVSISNSSVPVMAQLAVEGAVKDIFGYALSGIYQRRATVYSFYGTYGRQARASVNDVNELGADAQISVNTKSIDFNLNASYRNYGDKVIYMTPAWKVNGVLEYNYMERIYAEVGAKFFSSMVGNGVRYGGFVDLSAELKYVVNTKFTVFLKGGNLLNNQIFYLQDYVEPGVNFALGLFIKL